MPKRDDETKNRLLVLAGAVILVISLWIVGATMRARQSVEIMDSFDECAAAGYPIGESYPRQCFAPNGAFVEPVSEPTAPQE